MWQLPLASSHLAGVQLRKQNKKKKKSRGVDAPRRWGGIRSVSGKLAAVFSMSAPTETWSESEPDTTDATGSHTHTNAHRALSMRVLELPQLCLHTQAHTHTGLNMKPDVSPCKTAMYAFDFGMGSEIGKCKAP